MNGFLLETEVLACLADPEGAAEVKAWAGDQSERDLHISVIALAEIDRGIARLPDADPSRAHYVFNRDAIAARFSGRVLPLADRTVRRWGALAGRVLRDFGRVLPPLEGLVAAQALEAQLTLVARATPELEMTGVALLDPWTGRRSGPSPPDADGDGAGR